MLSLMSLWLHMVTQGCILIRGFDVFKTEQLYFVPYISLVTNGYRWLHQVITLSEACQNRAALFLPLYHFGYKWLQVVTA